MEEKEKKKISPIIIILVIIIIVMGCVIAYLIMNPNQEQMNSQNEQQETKEEVVITESEAKELIDYVPIPKASEWEDNGFLNETTNVSNLNINHLMYNAMQKVEKKGYDTCTSELKNANNLCDFTYNVDDIKQSFEKMYGTSISITDKVDGKFLWHCTRVDDVYACSNSGGGYCSAGPIYEYFGLGNEINIRKYQKVEKVDNNLIIYIKYARAVIDAPSVNSDGYACNKDWKPEEVTIKLYKYGTGDELITTDNGKNYYEENASKTFEEKLYDKYESQFTDYKITYKINGNNYSLISISPIK